MCEHGLLQVTCPRADLRSRAPTSQRLEMGKEAEVLEMMIRAAIQMMACAEQAVTLSMR